MLGVFLTGFLDMVEHHHGIETLDEMIANSDLKSYGIYTSIAVYDEEELHKMITSLAKIIRVKPEEIAVDYGRFYFQHGFASKPKEMEQFETTFDFIEGIQTYYRMVIGKIFPKEYIPTVDTLSRTSDKIIVRYSSKTKIPLFMKGVFIAAAKYFGEAIQIDMEYENGDGGEVLFSIQLANVSHKY